MTPAPFRLLPLFPLLVTLAPPAQAQTAGRGAVPNLVIPAGSHSVANLVDALANARQRPITLAADPSAEPVEGCVRLQAPISGSPERVARVLEALLAHCEHSVVADPDNGSLLALPWRPGEPEPVLAGAQPVDLDALLAQPRGTDVIATSIAMDPRQARLLLAAIGPVPVPHGRRPNVGLEVRDQRLFATGLREDVVHRLRWLGLCNREALLAHAGSPLHLTGGDVAVPPGDGSMASWVNAVAASLGINVVWRTSEAGSWESQPAPTEAPRRMSRDALLALLFARLDALGQAVTPVLPESLLFEIVGMNGRCSYLCATRAVARTAAQVLAGTAVPEHVFVIGGHSPATAEAISAVMGRVRELLPQTPLLPSGGLLPSHFVLIGRDRDVGTMLQLMPADGLDAPIDRGR